MDKIRSKVASISNVLISATMISTFCSCKSLHKESKRSMVSRIVAEDKLKAKFLYQLSKLNLPQTIIIIMIIMIIIIIIIKKKRKEKV